MKEILRYLFEYKTLSREQARAVLLEIGRGNYNESAITAFMTVYLMRSITIEELQGFREALLELCVPVRINDTPLLDIVGTGGDEKNTFNISTLACFVVAGAGQPVAKHGNYGASSVSGASNVMEQLGYRFKTDEQQLKREVEEAGICFLHAPLFHPALKVVGGIRKNLGMRTFFNMLGPMVNPANPDYQLVGVFNLEMARVYNYLLQLSGKQFTIIHSLDGYDEISLTNDTKVITNAGEQILSPQQLGARTISPEALYGGETVAESAKIFTSVLSGEGTEAQRLVVLANAAMGLFCTGSFPDYEAAFAKAEESLDSGMAYQSFKKLIALQS